MPLFASSTDLVKSRLRLTAVPDTSVDTLAIIDEAISWARLEFYRRLGRAQVADLVAITEVAEPTTDDEIRRTLATHTEIMLVRARLLRELPSIFMDASGDAHKTWNTEALFRERPRSSLDKEIDRLNVEIEQAMQILEDDGDESPGDERTIFGFDGTPDDAHLNPLPGDSITGSLNRRAVAED